MLYSILYGNKGKSKQPSSNSNSIDFKVAIQTEQVRNESANRFPVPTANLPCLLDSHGDDLILCEATKMVEDMIANVTLMPATIKTYPKKEKKLSKKFGNDSKIFQNILQLSNIYSQQSSNSILGCEENNALSIDCAEVDPIAFKYEINYEFECSPAGEEEDIFSLYDPLDVMEECPPEEIKAIEFNSSPTRNVPEQEDLHEYVSIEEANPIWHDIYSRIDDELFKEKLDEGGIFHSDVINKKFYIKIGNTLRLLSISVKDVPNGQINDDQKNQNSFVEHELFGVSTVKRRYESGDGEPEAPSPKKHLHDYNLDAAEELILQSQIKSPTVQNFADWNIPDLSEDEDYFVQSIKLEENLKPAADLQWPPTENAVCSPTIANLNFSPENPIQPKYEPVDECDVHNSPASSYGNRNNKFEPFINECFNGFQTGRGKPIDLPKNHVYKKYLQLYDKMDIPEDEDDEILLTLN